MMKDKVPIARLYEKTSARTGATYFVGRLGMARALLFKDRDQPEEGDAVWNLLVESIEETTPPTAAPASSSTRSPNRKPREPRKPTAERNEIVQDSLEDFGV